MIDKRKQIWDSTIECVLSNFFDIPETFNTKAENAEILKRVLNRTKLINNEERIVVNNFLETLVFYREELEN